MQISPYLPISPHISPYLVPGARRDADLPISPHISCQVLDVMQIFGRAGRPQFDVHGEGVIITEHKRLAHYLQLLTHQLPIESQVTNPSPTPTPTPTPTPHLNPNPNPNPNQFVKMLSDHLNAEISLGTVTSVRSTPQPQPHP